MSRNVQLASEVRTRAERLIPAASGRYTGKGWFWGNERRMESLTYISVPKILWQLRNQQRSASISPRSSRPRPVQDSSRSSGFYLRVVPFHRPGGARANTLKAAVKKCGGWSPGSRFVTTRSCFRLSASRADLAVWRNLTGLPVTIR